MAIDVTTLRKPSGEEKIFDRGSFALPQLLCCAASVSPVIVCGQRLFYRAEMGGDGLTTRH